MGDGSGRWRDGWLWSQRIYKNILKNPVSADSSVLAKNRLEEKAHRREDPCHPVTVSTVENCLWWHIITEVGCLYPCWYTFIPPNIAECTHKQHVPFTAFLACVYCLGCLQNIKRVFHNISGERGHQPYVLAQQELAADTFRASWYLDSEVSCSEPKMWTHAKWTQAEWERKKGGGFCVGKWELSSVWRSRNCLLCEDMGAV